MAQPGLFVTLKLRVSPSASEAVGRKLYHLSAGIAVFGVPEIEGGELLPEPVPVPVTVIENAGSEVVALPSLTRMTMLL